MGVDNRAGTHLSNAPSGARRKDHGWAFGAHPFKNFPASRTPDTTQSRLLTSSKTLQKKVPRIVEIAVPVPSAEEHERTIYRH